MSRYRAVLTITRITDYELDFEAADASEAHEIADAITPDECAEIDETTVEWTVRVIPLNQDDAA